MDPLQHLLFNEIVGNLQEAEEEVEELAARRIYLPREDAFALPEHKFIKKFRVSRELAQQIIEMVRPYLRPPSRHSALSIDTKVLVALRFLGFGSYQEITGSNCYTGVSQASVSRALNEFITAMNEPAIFNRWVHFPRNIMELQNLRRRFYERYEFPGVVGCIDCTHVAIVAPQENNAAHPEHAYVNRKNYHSINVQLICDENLKILNVNARFPGSVHDARIWGESAISTLMERIYRHNRPNSFFLIGDSGYPLRPWLLTPLENPEPNTPEERFNQRLCSVRNTVERCNGVLKNRFRCLLKHRYLHYSPQIASLIINTCVILHNMCIEHRIPEPADNDEEMVQADLGIYQFDYIRPHRIGRVHPDLVAARALQRQIINNNFLN